MSNAGCGRGTLATHHPSRPGHPRHRLATLGLLFALAACGGGSGGDDAASPAPVPPPPPPPVVNLAPNARFDVPAAAVAGQPLVFDGRSSSDPEGSTLRFSWQFGDGSAGGTAQIAHVYPAAGTYSATLRVLDAQGAEGVLTRSITVAAAPAAAKTVPLAGRVLGTDGAPLAGVAITVEGASGAGSSASTDADGRASLSVGAGVDVVLRFSKPGHTDQVQRLSLPASTGSDATFEAVLMPRSAPLTLADAAAGGSVVGADGASVQLPAAALVDAATGAAVTGAVAVTLSSVDINSAALAAFPGRFEGLNADGSRTPIVSFGTTEFLFTQGGRALQLKPGARATIQVPVYATQALGGAALAAGGAMPLWSLDERSGQWVAEGQGSLVAEAASPTGLAMRAEVGHFSWWNADMGYVPYRPKPRCINDVPGQYDSIFEQATICKMLAEMDKPIPAQGAAGPGRQQALSVRGAGSAASAGPAASAGSAMAPGGSMALASPSATAAATTPRFPFPAVRILADLPMAGGPTLDIPPEQDMLLTGTALNGTWRGQLRVKGGQGATADVSVPLRPVAVGGSAERISLPFDQLRSAAAFRLDTYRFDAAAGQSLELTVGPEASTLSGRVRVLDATGQVLDGASFGPATARLLVSLPATGEYRVEISPGSGAPGAYRLQAALVTATPRLPSAMVSDGEPAGTPAMLSQGGTALALWVARQGSGLALVGSRNSAATQDWGAPQALAPATGYTDSLGLQARSDASGQAWVLWNDGTGPVLARGPLAGGAAWAAPVALASASCRGTDAQHLVVNASGQALVAWQRGGAIGIWCWRRFDAGAWGPEQVLDSTARFQAPGSTPATSLPMALALTDAGRAVAVWQRNEFGGGLLLAEQATASAAWSSPTPMFSDNAGGGPVLAASSAGHLLLAWWRNGSLQVAEQPPGEGWSSPASLGAIGSSANPQPAWLGPQRWALGWNSFNSGPRLVERALGQPLGSPQALASGTSLPLLASLAAAPDGTAVAVSLANSRAGVGTELVVDRRQPATGAWATLAQPLAARAVVSGAVPLPRLAPLALGQGWADAAWLAPPVAGSSALQVRAARLPAAP